MTFSRYRKTVFIFLSNTGSKKIVEFVLNWWGEGKTRADITLKDIEYLVQNGAFNEKGWTATIIQSQEIMLVQRYYVHL